MIYKGSIVKGSGGGSGDAVWGSITGTLSDQTDLQTALNGKQDLIDSTHKLSASLVSGLANVATSGSYNDLTNTPSIPAAQVNSDWNASSGVAQILNKPNLATVATTGAYSDLSGTPTIPTVNNATLTINQGGSLVGTFTANASSDVTINLAAGGGSVDIDDSTITENAQDKIQAVGLINANTASSATNPLKLWEGTQAEYNVGGGVKGAYYAWKYTSSVTATAQSITSAEWKTPVYTGSRFVTISYGIAMYLVNGESSWVEVALPLSTDWNTPAYGGGNIIAFDNSSSNKCLHSSDGGDTWSVSNMPSSSGWQVPAYGDGRFVTVGQGSDKAAYTTDGGATWTEVSMPESGWWRAPAYGNGVFATAKGMVVAYSEDGGETWSESSVGYDVGDYIFFADGLFVMPRGQDSYILYSDDNCRTWHKVMYPAQGYDSLMFAEDRFIMFKSSKIAYSTDHFATWTEENVTSGTINLGAPVAYADGMFMSAGMNVASYSSDFGKNWTSLNLAGYGNNPTTPVYGDGKFIVTCGNSAQMNNFAFTTKRCYTTDETPTTASIVYSAPDVVSALTITAVGTGTITLSDTDTYDYYDVSNTTTYYTVGETYPNLLCNIDGVGVKKGDTIIADATGNVSVFTTNHSGLVPAPSGSDSSKYLKGDGTWSVVSATVDSDLSATSQNAVQNKVITYNLANIDNAAGKTLKLISRLNSSGVIQTEQPNDCVFTGLTKVLEDQLIEYFKNDATVGNVNMPDLTEIENNGLSGCFNGCIKNESFLVPNLATVKLRGLGNVCENNPRLTSVNFSSLSVIWSEALYEAFKGCELLEDVYFPAVTSSTFQYTQDQFVAMLTNTGTTVTHKLHFPSNLSLTVQGLTGYPEFGGTSGYVTVSFDLPATS